MATNEGNFRFTSSPGVRGVAAAGAAPKADDRRPEGRPKNPAREGFTLVELLVVLVIVGLIAAATLPPLLGALASRQNREAGRLLYAALAGCRARAIASGRPAGIRLLPDPAFPVARTAGGSIDPSAVLCYSRWEPIGPAPDYSEGRVTARAGAAYAPAVTNPAGAAVACPSLILESAPAAPTSPPSPNPPTSWAWNLRVGDRVQVGGAGPWYAVCGPDWTGPAGNPERFVNWGPPGTPSPLAPGGVAVEWLVLANGRDDDGNGWPDSGFDGVDNNADGSVDEPAEWEPEAWLGAAAGLASVPYSARRRPFPTPSAGDAGALPARTVIDATGWGSSTARSRLPVDPVTGAVEILVAPDGSVSYSLPYGVPTSVAMGAAWLHFWVSDRADVRSPPVATPAGEWGLFSVNARTGMSGWLQSPDPTTCYARAQQGVSD